ncbi:MAG: NAD(P)/FAD-dependent oxidoreductase [Gammaproteobacteria bacterium]|nr:NAD(P)/FAD-dependent oxidoreductase [Gammaproteobacteria bacterium]
MVDRRSFLKIASGMAATVLPSTSPAVTQSCQGARVVIVGAGVAGVRAAVRLKQSAPKIDIALIDPIGYGKASPLAKINSIVMMDSPVSLSITGIKVVSQHVIEVDPVNKRVLLQNGGEIYADLLVLAPGVEFKHDDRTSHPLNESVQRRQLEAMHDGDNVIVTIPKAPYQYPQGPYITVSRIADYLHASKPASKVIVFDHNSGSSIAELYRRQWSRKVATARIEHVEVEAGYIAAADYQTGVIDTADGRIRGGVIALMDEQRAAVVAREAGLSLQGDWCHVKQRTLESLHYADVYVLGDANDAAQWDKTAFTAVQQADAFVRAITASPH